MNEEEKKAIEIVKKIKDMKFKVTSSFYSSGTISLSIEEKEAIDTVLNLITKLQKENEEKDKQIDLMAYTLQDNLYLTPLDGLNKEELKQYFETKAKKGE